MSQSIRGKNANIQIVVDGDLKGGSFAKVTNFNLKPRQDIDETGFIGESEDELTFNHKGWDFSFTTHEWDPRLIRLILDIVARDRAREAHPSINVVVTTEYYSSSEPSITVVMENCKLMMDGRDIGGANDFITCAIQGKCKIVTEA